NFRLAQVHHVLGNYPRALHLYEQTIGVLTGERVYRAFTGPNLTAVLSRSYRVRSLVECGRFVEAGPVAEEAVRIAEAIEYLNSLVVALPTLGMLHVRRGDLGAAIPVLERAVHL